MTLTESSIEVARVESNGSKQDDAIELNTFWQILLILLSLPCPIFAVMYVSTKKLKYNEYSILFTNFSMLAILLLFFSTPKNKRLKSLQTVYVALYTIASGGMNFLGAWLYKDIHEVSRLDNLLNMVVVAGAFPIVAFLRGRFEFLPNLFLQKHIKEEVFTQGFSAFPVLAYLAGEGLKCVVDGGADNTCEMILLPQFCISFSVVAYLGARIILSPLSPNNIYSFEDIIEYSLLPFSTRLQLFCCGVLLISNALLFGRRNEEGGKADSFMWLLYFVSLGSIAFAAIIDLALILTDLCRKNNRGNALELVSDIG